MRVKSKKSSGENLSNAVSKNSSWTVNLMEVEL